MYICIFFLFLKYLKWKDSYCKSISIKLSVIIILWEYDYLYYAILYIISLKIANITIILQQLQS